MNNYNNFIISILLGLLLILNSNYVNKKRTEDKLNQDKNLIFKENNHKRALAKTSNNKGDNSILNIINEKSNEICKKGSDELNEYYQTGDLSKIDLKIKQIECEDKDKDYMKALIDITREIVDERENSENLGGKKIFGIHQKLIIRYFLHLLPFIIIFVIGLFSIIGWIIFCICTCCDCCCCCCCKKEKCKIPCFIINYIFYILTIIACIYGLIQSNKLFIDIANVKCSLLKLIDQVIDGETKQSSPRWIGIKGFIKLLSNLNNNIENTKENILKELQEKKNLIELKKDEFNNKLNEFDDECYNGGKYLNGYTKFFNDINIEKYKNKIYVLDLIKTIGHADKFKNYPNPSFLYSLKNEYSKIVEKCDKVIQIFEDSFNILFKDEIYSKIDLSFIVKISNNIINGINDKYSEFIEDNTNDIFKFSKLGLNLFFSFLILINCALAILLFLIYYFSNKPLITCCCFRYGFKISIHILWNIFSFMMFISLIFGSVFAFVARIGNDGMSLVYFILSKENLENNINPLIVGNSEDFKKVMIIILHGNGNIENEFYSELLGLNFENLIFDKMDNLIQKFNRTKNNLPSFSSFLEQIQIRDDYLSDDFSLLEISDSESPIYLKSSLESLNTNIKIYSDKKEIWSINGDIENKCSNGIDSFKEGKYIFHPKYCKPLNRDWISSSHHNIKDYAIIISSIVDIINKLNTGSFPEKLSSLNLKYNEYLDSYIDMLNFLKMTLNNLIGEILDKSESGTILGIFNGKFIGINLNIILNYIKILFGEDLYKVGISLIIIGFSSIISISSTIVLISIINYILKQKIEVENKPNITREKNNNNNVI